jgi:monoamine oxidase
MCLRVKEMSKPFSRRDFLNLVGAAGGSAAVFQVTTALGITPTIEHSITPGLTPLKGRKCRVILLGAGISALTSAYELSKAGYECIILEASHRAGGRNLTLRQGDFIDEVGNPQQCQFDDAPHLYMNAGAARIPHTHHKILAYCKELGVELEIFENDNRNAWVQDPKFNLGKPVRSKEYLADARGFMAELMAKSITPEDLDAPFSELDAELLLNFIKRYGDLSDAGLYKGSTRAGYLSGGMLSPGIKKGVFDFSELLKADFWKFRMHWAEAPDQGSPLLQPVGGMDMIVKGFMKKVGHLVTTGAQVRSIMNKSDSIAVEYEHKGELKQIEADYCLNCIPTHLVTGLIHNFPTRYVEGLKAVGRGNLTKIGFQANERFWEKESIYGGISWTNQDIQQIWYPSHGIHREKGIILGAYVFGNKNGQMWGELKHEERIERALLQGEQVHPDYRKYLSAGVTIPWHRMNHMLGCDSRWSAQARNSYFKVLQQASGRHYMMGDQISYHPAWQEGAVSSAHFTINEIDKREQANRVTSL